ncbi:hypothetical protein [Arcobacter sp. CECT 8989]|nr:hypothetical protein [Arcobacter sp. CECT 8989]
MNIEFLTLLIAVFQMITTLIFIPVLKWAFSLEKRLIIIETKNETTKG